MQTSSGNLAPRRNEQRLLRNMGVHSVVLELLQVGYFFPPFLAVWNQIQYTWFYFHLYHLYLLLQL